MPRIYRGVGIRANRLFMVSLFLLKSRRDAQSDGKIGTEVLACLSSFGFARIRHIAVDDDIAWLSFPIACRHRTSVCRKRSSE